MRVEKMSDYSCGAQFCDDPACIIHGAKDADGDLVYSPLQDGGLTAGLFAANGAGSSSTWCTKTPQEILDEINTILTSTWAHSVNEKWCLPDLMWLPRQQFWWLKYGVLYLFLRSRKTHRPEKFTRRIGK